MKINLNPSFGSGEDFCVDNIERHGLVPSCKENLIGNPPFKGLLTQVIMRLHFIVLLFGLGLSQVSAYTFAQQITLHRKGSNLESILKELEKQSGYSFFYKKGEVAPVRNISVNITNMPLQQALDNILAKADFRYDIFGKTVVLKKAPLSAPVRVKLPDSKAEVEMKVQQFIRGRVLDENGDPVKGASVRLKSNASAVVVSGEDGEFILPLTAMNEVLIVSYVGYEAKELKATLNRNQMIVRLQRQEEAVDEVVVTGILERRKSTFTGATATFSGEELKMINNQSVIHSLRSLDPSFIFIENNSIGSNPNGLPTIELRGQTSISVEALQNEFSVDPNQPLFVLDGFETTLRTIMDLDMNIISSVTILKDAASTAIYGSRASNGVVVVETIKPKEGKVILSYTTDLRAEISDLRSYNMMNAAEKLEFERLSGRYISNSSYQSHQLDLDELYNNRLAEVQRGVNTYWLSQPLQTGFSNRHSLSARGGQGAILFDLGANYRDTRGVMKESGRKDYGANLNVNYRTGKFNFSNRAYLTGARGDESPFGSFSSWVNTNPYYRLLGADQPYLADETSKNYGYRLLVANPLYNANLNSTDFDKSLQINNNIQMNVDFNNSLRLALGGQISKGLSTGKTFVSPLHTKFDGVENLKRGEYNESSTDDFAYTANIMLTYAKTFSLHSITGNGRVEFRENQSRLTRFSAIGFPAAATGNPAFAFGYPEGQKPTGATNISRSNSFILSGNYSFDQRYNVDLSLNFDGTTAFGSNRKYSPYFAAGFSWNINNESFIKSQEWINALRLRGNVGLTGNQNFSNVNQSVFNYYSDVNRFGQGIYLSALGAPDLEWQKTSQTSLGFDGTFFNKKWNMQVNAYRKYTSPLVVAVTLPASTGLNNYPFNAGALTTDGIEFMLNYSPIFRPEEQVVLTFGLMGNTMKQRYSKFDNKLETLNKELQQSNSLTRYRDGADPRDMWAVPSMGIDPATGREIFLSKSGQYTFVYNANDQVIVGNAQPLAEGTFNSALSYKGFTAGIVIRYIWQKDIMNSALYNKVENISLGSVENNQDRRALYDRWKNIGDNARFKAISITTSTPMSSRFLQEESTLSGESISLGYQLRNKGWLDRVGLSGLRMTGYLNEIFYISTIRRERGIDYPFARSVSFSLSANFK